MQNILFSRSFTEKTNSILRRFWWQGVQVEDSSKPFYFRSWDDIYQPKCVGGLGIRNLYTVNKSLVLHSAWLIVSNKDPFLSSVLKAKYFPNTSFWRAACHGTRFAFWSSVMQVKHHLQEQCVVQIHQGNSNIWTDPWCENWENIHTHLKNPHIHRQLPNLVSDLWNQKQSSWNRILINSTFQHQAVDSILQVHKVSSSSVDQLCWKHSIQGTCSTKEVYKYLSIQNTHSLPSHGPSSISSAALSILIGSGIIKPCLASKLSVGD
uniref:Reverse transcriptase zinc-binding domain-containing protein n=1 Tax=Setaria viridis TaxID=4556 RepID=A0A4U6TJA9_SETVI|nr:hypothetical protein SEVIR_8G148566v2 [Setaria viridis]